jgi:hypothetical protein
MKNLFLLFFITKTILTFGQDWIQETDIPLPEIIYELPESLIGEFIMNSPEYDFKVTIFSNNKYIISIEVNNHHYLDFSWGHIVLINNVWYFSPLSSCFFNGRLQEIQLLDNGFSFSNLRSIRKEDIPVPTNLAKHFSLPRRIVKNQYFENNNLYRFNYNEILNYNDALYSHSLVINNGIVTIICGAIINDYEQYIYGIVTEFIGFIDLIEENNNNFKGIIKFTNGVPYNYIEDGTAEIEKVNDDIFITMLYIHLPRPYNIPEGFQFPIKLILEF